MQAYLATGMPKDSLGSENDLDMDVKDDLDENLDFDEDVDRELNELLGTEDEKEMDDG